MFNNMDINKALAHDSAGIKYRKPLGALKTGEKVSLRLLAQGISFERVFLVVINGIYKEEIEMRFSGGKYSCDYYLPQKPVVLWYYFRIVSGETTIYYGRSYEQTAGLGKVYWDAPPAFQLTVYDKNFTVPEWFSGAVMYQIFPDRFCMGDKRNREAGRKYHEALGRNVYIHEGWDEDVIYQPLEGKENYEPVDCYGGDIAGIISRLPYLKEMGVSVLYLNPIFEAASNHRYNTADYNKIDPFLGTEEDFAKLCEKAGEMGIKIMLDGVFSHTGDDSVYFNKYGRYKEKGAYQGEESRYFPWYKFDEFPDNYKCWWGFKSLPEVNEHEKSWESFVISGEHSVMKSWIKKGAAGFRLDVADELPDDVIEKMRKAIKSENGESVLLGEVWEDATTKQSYGAQRTYALGRALDSVMNYPFRNAVVDYLMFRKNAYELKSFLVAQSQNYPREMYYSLMNLLSSHDVERIHTLLSTSYEVTELSREQQAHIAVQSDMARRGEELQKLGAALQFSIPGVPCIYYGDEYGMDGLKDPFNRKPFAGGSEALRGFYKKIAEIRNTQSVMKSGGCVFYACCDDILGVLRFDEKKEVLLTVINRSEAAKSFAVDMYGGGEGLDEGETELLRSVETKSAKCLLSGKSFGAYNGIIGGSLEPREACVIKIG